MAENSNRRTRPPAATTDDYRRLRAAIAEWGDGGSDDRPRDWRLLLDVVDTLALTGMQVWDVLNLRPRYVADVEDGYVHVEDGWYTDIDGVVRGLHRQVVVPKALLPIVQRRVREATRPDGPLFPTSSERWFDDSSFRRQFRICRRLAGLPDTFTPNALRRMAADELMSSAEDTDEEN